ncbi:uncharacterized protein ACIB01_005011 [Guaruba guarouba]
MKVGCVEGYKYTGEDCIAVTFLFFAISKPRGDRGWLLRPGRMLGASAVTAMCRRGAGGGDTTNGAVRLGPPVLPRPSFGFLRAVSRSRKRVHEASARIFRSQEFLLVGNSEERLEPGLCGRGVRGTGTPWGWPAGRGVPSGGGSPAAVHLPWPRRGSPFPGAAGETQRQRFPSPRGERLSAVTFRSHQLHRRHLRPHGATTGVFTTWGSPRPVSVHAKAERTCLAACGSPWGHACLLGARASMEQGLCGGWVGRGLFAAPASVCASFCTEASSVVDEMSCNRGVQAWAVQIKSSYGFRAMDKSWFCWIRLQCRPFPFLFV